MTWRPDDAELDDVARSLDRPERSAERAEHDRTALLAAAAGRTQMSRRSRVPYAIAGVAFAAAAAVAIWIAARPSEHAAPAVASVVKQRIAPIGVARFANVSDWADFVVRLDDGKLAIEVGNLDAADRFRVTTTDGEVETHGARFDVAAEQGHVASLDVHEGRVELRRAGEQVVILAAGQSWARVKTAIREDVPLPAPVTAPAPAPRHDAAKKIEAPPVPKIEAPAPKIEAPPPAPRVATPTPAPAPDPGEAEFRAGMASLRGGDATNAARSFATACTLAKHGALGDDACFWSGAAAKRAGDTQAARGALGAFLHDFPSSARAPEAAALLGWIDYDAGDLDAAEALFHRAEHDRVPQVRDSAQRGLTAIDRKRRAH